MIKYKIVPYEVPDEEPSLSTEELRRRATVLRRYLNDPATVKSAVISFTEELARINDELSNR